MYFLPKNLKLDSPLFSGKSYSDRKAKTVQIGIFSEIQTKNKSKIFGGFFRQFLVTFFRRMFEKVGGQPQRSGMQQRRPRRTVMRSATIHRVVGVKCASIAR